jgi:hypothetical protein
VIPTTAHTCGDLNPNVVSSVVLLTRVLLTQ